VTLETVFRPRTNRRTEFASFHDQYSRTTSRTLESPTLTNPSSFFIEIKYERALVTGIALGYSLNPARVGG